MTLRRLCLIASCLLSTHTAASAQDWPTRPIRAIIPFGAGSATDLVPRIVFEQLSPQLGQPIVVENRTGAGGTLGTSAVAKADPDGYTLLAHSNAFSVAPAIYSNLPYDTANDFAAIIPFGSLPAVLVMAPSKGFKTIQEMVAAAKAKPGSFNYASVGVGSGTHLSAEKLKLGAGFDAVHIPFRGGPEALTEVDGRAGRFLFLPDQHGAAAYPRGQARGAGDERHRARTRTARRADHARGRLQGRRFPDLDRHAGAGQDAARRSSTGSTRRRSRRSRCRPRRSVLPRPASRR